jgi:hypothetical protein
MTIVQYSIAWYNVGLARKLNVYDELHIARFWKIQKTRFKSFKKFQNKILDVDNELFY